MTPIEKIDKDTLKELYDKDFPLWAEINYMLLKEKAYEFVDWDNLLEEILDMAKSDLKACVSYLAVILEHLYKWDNFRSLAGGDTAGMGWIKGINNARRKLRTILEIYPSLASKLPHELENAWKWARSEFENWLEENGYDPEKFPIPERCPYTYEEALNRKIKAVKTSLPV